MVDLCRVAFDRSLGKHKFTDDKELGRHFNRSTKLGLTYVELHLTVAKANISSQTTKSHGDI